MDSPIVLTERQLSVWTVPPRPEIVEALLTHGPMTVAELAPALARKPKGLYYHLKALEKVGLVEVKETRRATRREEAVYGLVSRSMRMSKDLSDPAYRQAMQDSVASTLRAAERTNRRLLDAAEADPELYRQSTILTTIARLRPEDLQKVLALAAELHAQAKAAHDPANPQPVMVTLAVLPVPPRE